MVIDFAVDHDGMRTSSLSLGWVQLQQPSRHDGFSGMPFGALGLVGERFAALSHNPAAVVAGEGVGRALARGVTRALTAIAALVVPALWMRFANVNGEPILPRADGVPETGFPKIAEA
ncbi:hypothetical protein ACIBHX_00915 [Nonomuraea sp. NPDC050536]|uniref:hypothetical protein n=1 Tax=Nonomuraea sp. NPDC050536 TaxID=3364366 RepID=UPI0037C795CA